MFFIFFLFRARSTISIRKPPTERSHRDYPGDHRCHFLAAPLPCCQFRSLAATWRAAAKFLGFGFGVLEFLGFGFLGLKSKKIQERPNPIKPTYRCTEAKSKKTKSKKIQENPRIENQIQEKSWPSLLIFSSRVALGCQTAKLAAWQRRC